MFGMPPSAGYASRVIDVRRGLRLPGERSRRKNYGGKPGLGGDPCRLARQVKEFAG
jgi:hypothetical protein